MLMDFGTVFMLGIVGLLVYSFMQPPPHTSMVHALTYQSNNYGGQKPKRSQRTAAQMSTIGDMFGASESSV